MNEKENLIAENCLWKHGKLWKLKISLENGHSINNLKVFYSIYDNRLVQKVKSQSLSDRSDCNEGLNFARKESEYFHLVIRTNNKQFYEGMGRKEIPPDYWYLPSYDSLTNCKNKENSSEPSDDNEFVLTDGAFFLKIKILSDQLVSEYWFKLILKDENAFLIKLKLSEKIKLYFHKIL